MLGLLWIPLWNWAARRNGPAAPVEAEAAGAASLLRDRRLWAFVAANALSMIGYSLWTNWTTLYLVDVHHLTLAQAAWYAWIPPLAATLGGFAGGWLSLRLIRGGTPPPRGRFRVCLLASVVALVTAAVPAAPTAGLGRRRNLAQHLRRGRLQRQHVHAAAGRIRRRSRGFRGVLPGGFLRRRAGRRLAGLRPAHRSVRLPAGHGHRGSHAAGRLRGPVGHEVGRVKQRFKRWIFGLLGKDPEAVVVTFSTGDADLCRRMAEEVRALEPDRRHFVATEANWPELRRELRRYRIGLAPVMLTRQPSALRRAAYRLAPRKILAYNSRLERHHLRPSLASFLFWRGVPLDRIYLRPWWWPWPKRERSVTPTGDRVLKGRPCSPERRRVAVLSPYFPYPLAHGGAVRIFNLLRETAREFDVELFAFTDDDAEPPAAPVLEFCAPRGPGHQAALPRAALVHAAAARGSRVPLARHAERHRARARRLRFRGAASRVHATRPILAATCWWSTMSPSICLHRSRAASAPSPLGGTGFAGAASKPAPSAPPAAWW